MTDPASLTFLSWTRTGLLPAAAPDPLSGPVPGVTTVPIGTRVNDRDVIEIPVRLHSPGDVVAVDHSQVIRTDPSPGDDTFPPHLFPLIEFDRPELPWLLTPSAPADRDRLRPWLVLVVVDRERAQLVAGNVDNDADGAALPVLLAELEDLPDLAESHLWAHAQVVLDGPLDDARVDRLLSDAPDRTLSRLLCPRRLDPRRPYLACVVPAFEAGRLAGLGATPPIQEQELLSPAWSAGTGSAPPLPVYYHWEFATGEAGSFEALVSKLAGRPLPPQVGLMPIDVSHPGGGLPDLTPGQAGSVIDLEGALKTPSTSAAPWDEATRQGFEASLRPLLDPAATEEELTPPVYGMAQAGRTRFTADADQLAWLRDLNLDPRHRAVAALGARAVQDNQEDLVAATWDLLAELAKVNQAQRQGQLARTVAGSVYDRRIDLSRPGSVLSDARLLQVSRPTHAELGTSAQLETAAGLVATTRAQFRSATRPGRALSRQGGRQIAVPMERLATRNLTVNPHLEPPAGMTRLEQLSSTPVEMPDADQVLVPWWVHPSTTESWPTPAEPRALFPGAVMPGRVFVTTTDGRLLSRVTGITGLSGWQDHGHPEGTLVVSAPTAVRDLFAYVICADGHLWGLAWDGDRWGWHCLPLPDGGHLDPHAALLGTWADASPASGDYVTSGEYNLVWAIGADQNLWQRFNGGWRNLGRPPGAGVVGSPGQVHPYAVLVTDTNKRQAMCSWNSKIEGWEWWTAQSTNHTVGTGVSVAIRAARFAVGENPNELYLAVGRTPYENWQLSRSDLGAVLGVDGTTLYISTTTGAVLRLDATDRLSFNAYLPPPPGLATGEVVRGTVGPGGVIWAAVGGRYLEGANGTWIDHGLPQPPGVGAPDAPPAAHRRWLPTVGLMSTVLVGQTAPSAGGTQISSLAGSDVGYAAEVRQGWSEPAPMPEPITTSLQGAGVALGDVRGRGGDAPRRDLVNAWITDRQGGNFITYRVGFDLGATGVPGSWSAVQRCPTPVATAISSGGGLSLQTRIRDCDVDLADLDGDGRPEIVVAYVTGHSQQRACYRIGWHLAADGSVTEGWSGSQSLPNPSGRVVGVGACVVDTTASKMPDLVVLYVIQDQPGGPVKAEYYIGRGLNARGVISGGWTQEPIPVGGGPLPSDVQGAALAAADFTGSEAADLVVLLNHNDPSGNTSGYRIGLDLSATTGHARGWTSDQPVPGGTGSVSIGVCIGDLDPGLLAVRQAFATAFTDAAKAHQAAIAPLQRTPPVEDGGVSLAKIAEALRWTLRPDERVEDRVTGRISVPIFGVSDRLSPVLPVPQFDTPAYQLVGDLARDYLLPGADLLPANTVSLLTPSPAFIEALMVGFNHELSREFLWRGVPVDRRATYLQRFWERSDGVADIPPIADWDPAAGLGATANRGELAILVVRGEVLRRHPATEVYAIKAEYDQFGLRVPGTETLRPTMQASMTPDVALFGFTLTANQVMGAEDAGWFFAFAEHPTAPRFGLDEPGAAPSYGTAAPSWADLDWARVAPDAVGLDALVHVPATLPFPRETELPLRTDRPNSDAFRWAENSAHQAHITLQRPVLVAIHGSDLLTKVTDG